MSIVYLLAAAASLAGLSADEVERVRGEFTSLGQRLEKGHFNTTQSEGKIGCSIEKSTGDEELDATFCQAVQACSQTAHATPEFGVCMSEQQRELLLQLALRRTGFARSNEGEATVVVREVTAAVPFNFPPGLQSEMYPYLACLADKAGLPFSVDGKSVRASLPDDADCSATKAMVRESALKKLRRANRALTSAEREAAVGAALATAEAMFKPIAGPLPSTAVLNSEEINAEDR